MTGQECKEGWVRELKAAGRKLDREARRGTFIWWVIVGAVALTCYLTYEMYSNVSYPSATPIVDHNSD